MPGMLGVRFKILQRDNFTCQYCGRGGPDVRLEIDHIVPRALGGRNNVGNLLTACFDCNRGKRDTPLSPEQVAQFSNRPLLARSPRARKTPTPKPVPSKNRLPSMREWMRQNGIDGPFMRIGGGASEPVPYLDPERQCEGCGELRGRDDVCICTVRLMAQAEKLPCPTCEEGLSVDGEEPCGECLGERDYCHICADYIGDDGEEYCASCRAESAV